MAASSADVSDTMAAAAAKKKIRQSWRNLDILCMARGMTGRGMGNGEQDEARD